MQRICIGLSVSAGADGPCGTEAEAIERWNAMARKCAAHDGLVDALDYALGLVTKAEGETHDGCDSGCMYVAAVAALAKARGEKK